MRIPPSREAERRVLGVVGVGEEKEELVGRYASAKTSLGTA